MNIHSEISENQCAPVVALHSSASTGKQWKSLVHLLTEKHKVITPNLPGYGGSTGRDPNLENLTEYSLSTLDEIVKLKTPVHLVGHSFGGAVALKIAMKRPDLIKSLILYEPAAFFVLKNKTGGDDNHLDELEVTRECLAKATCSDDRVRGMQTFIDFWNGAGTWDSLPASNKDGYEDVAGTVSNDFDLIFAETWRTDDRLVFKFPTLIMMGLESPMVAQRTAIALVNSIPAAEFAILPDLGHMAPVQSPNWINPRIQEHISRTERNAGLISWSKRNAA